MFDGGKLADEIMCIKRISQRMWKKEKNNKVIII